MIMATVATTFDAGGGVTVESFPHGGWMIPATTTARTTSDGSLSRCRSTRNLWRPHEVSASFSSD
ncbi:hypothetical protein M6B38_387555 [Iris pallida]|uniref:Uncharacterized protein n=1 Tax=Iris pallida TaxID=29817 RepID=A0AAX6G261_IRIPA|nr:hypothetical protein M6B38_235045 [Iris pallida]KAJ6822826.1 hypothetical protein M6B38_387555 [Iris pallida]